MNPMDIIKNLQELQSQMGSAQEKLRSLRAEGSAGGELVKITVDGTMEALSVTIDPIAVDPRDVKMLEELIAAAFTDGARKMHKVIQREMSQFAGGLGFPPEMTDGGDT